MFKKLLSIVLIVVMVFGMETNAFASSSINENETQVNMLFNEMTENLALSLLEDNSTNTRKCNEKVEQIENQLSTLGVQKLSEEELNKFFDEKGVESSRFNKPANSNTVTWYLYSHPNYSYGSTKYDIQRLIAIGNNPGGMLITGDDNVKFYSGENKVVGAIQNAFGIYVQKAIGTIPVIQLTPYELLFSSSPSNVFNSSYITHRCVSSLSFIYVKKASQSEDYYTLSLYSNKLSIAAHAHGAAVVNSKPKTYSKQTTNTVESDHYNSIPDAIESYNGANGSYDYISGYRLESYDGQYSKQAYVPTPMAGPGQVY